MQEQNIRCTLGDARGVSFEFYLNVHTMTR